jgi:threonine synthase
MSVKSSFWLRCVECGEELDPDQIVYTCPSCGGLLKVLFDLKSLPPRIRSVWDGRPLSVWRYRELLPVRSGSKAVTLGEGGTGLHRCERLGRAVGVRCLYVKNEGENPTGSFKDRGMTVGVTRAVELGAKVLACASTGNTSASLAAYAAKAGLRCIVLIPSGAVAQGKLAQAVVHGADVVQVRGNFDRALEIVRQLCSDYRVYLLNSVNPFRLEGQKTIAFEIVDQLGGEVPDCVVVPVGNAGNISAIWKGFEELVQLGLADRAPRMIGVQAEGAAPIVEALRRSGRQLVPVSEPETVASAVRIGSPVNWRKAVDAIERSRGMAEKVSDREILEAQSLLARAEGLFVEPAGAVPLAGLRKLVDSGSIGRDEVVVCVATGHGLKDVQAVADSFKAPVEVDDSVEAVSRALSLEVVG